MLEMRLNMSGTWHYNPENKWKNRSIEPNLGACTLTFPMMCPGDRKGWKLSMRTLHSGGACTCREQRKIVLHALWLWRSRQRGRQYGEHLLHAAVMIGGKQIKISVVWNTEWQRVSYDTAVSTAETTDTSIKWKYTIGPMKKAYTFTLQARPN